MAAAREGVHGPSWGDVRLMMAEVGAAHDKRIDVHLVTASGANRSNDLVWNVRAWRWGQWGEGRPYYVVSGIFPAGQWQTVPALLFNLLHRMDSEMTAMEESARRARPLPLPGLE